MMMSRWPQSTTTYMPGPATMEGPPAEPPQLNVPIQHPPPSPPPQRVRRKRKADAQDAHNERLSKRMSLLNLEQNGQKLYVPVEQPQNPPSALTSSIPTIIADDSMQLDDTKHKVYIYNIDDELSSDNESDPGEGKLVFLPDIEKHMRANRLTPGVPGGIPKSIFPNKDGELAGMQLVLYSDGPSSISVPEEQDSVRKAILEARARLREKQSAGRGGNAASSSPASTASMGGHPAVAVAASRMSDAKPTKISFATPVKFGRAARQSLRDDTEVMGGPSSVGGLPEVEMMSDDDADAMDID